jgi:hypothetical protein
VMVDARFSVGLKRQANSIFGEMTMIEARDARETIAGKRRFEIDATPALQSFVIYGTTETSDLIATLREIKTTVDA